MRFYVQLSKNGVPEIKENFQITNLIYITTHKKKHRPSGRCFHL